ncbi:MAG: hypothetical protein ABJF88_03350 [Rhodothermales bacterium]
MPRSLSRARALCVAFLVLPAGCATERTVLPATSPDLPDHFVVGAFDSAETTEPAPGSACRSPLVDPRDGTRLILFESTPGRGLYEVPDGRYGLDDDYLLQVDCGTGRALGIVRR